VLRIAVVAYIKGRLCGGAQEERRLLSAGQPTVGPRIEPGTPCVCTWNATIVRTEMFNRAWLKKKTGDGAAVLRVLKSL